MQNAHSGLNGDVSPEDDVDVINTFKYSMKRFKKATKCSAFLMLPGMASFSRSSGRTSDNKLSSKHLKGNLTGV